MAIHQYNAGITVISLVFMLIFISQKTLCYLWPETTTAGNSACCCLCCAGILGALLAGNNKLVYPSLGALLAAAVR